MNGSRLIILVIGLLLLFGCASTGPKNVSAKAVPGGIQVSWDPSPQADVSGYNVYRSTSNDTLGAKVNPTMLSTNTYSDNLVQDGVTYYYTVKAVAGGTESDGSLQASVTAKTIPPHDMSMLIDEGIQFTGSQQVDLKLSAISASQCRFSNDASVWSDWEPYAPSKSWALSSGDGPKIVYYQCRDDVGNIASPVEGGIDLETVPPNVTLSSPVTGATYESPFNLTFAVGESDALPVTCSATVDGNPIAVGVITPDQQSTISVTAAPGQHVFSMTCFDGVNNATVGSSFTISNKPDLAINIQSGAGYTDSIVVYLDVSSSTASSCRYSNDGETWSSWKPYQENVSWLLSTGDGTKYVYGQCRNDQGDVSDTASDSIILDSKPPPYISIQINGGSSWTNTPNVQLGLYAYSAQLCHYSNDGYTWTSWQPYTTGMAWSLSGATGTKTVYYECKDRNGNLIGSTSASIKYSLVQPKPPTGMSIQINGGSSYTYNRRVTLNLNANGADQCRLSDDSSGWTDWQDYATYASWTLSSGGGSKTVYYQCMNDWGTRSTYSTIYLETGPPGPINDLQANVNYGTVYLSWSVPTGDVASYRIYRSTHSLGLFTMIATTYSPGYSDSNVVGDEGYSYYVDAVDHSGNEAQQGNLASVQVPSPVLQ